MRDTRETRDAYLGCILELVWRAGWARRHECALAAMPWKPLPAATRSTQRAIEGAVEHRLLQRRGTPDGCAVLYGLTARGAAWLRERRGLETAGATLVSLAEASRFDHRRISTQIAVTSTLLGCGVLHERELLQPGNFGTFSREFGKIPDVFATWDDDEPYAAFHEVDWSHRNAQGDQQLQAFLRRLADCRGRVMGRHVRVVVFHVRDRIAKRRVSTLLTNLWATERKWGTADPGNGIWTCVSAFDVLVQSVPTPTYWPLVDGLALPWRGPHPLVPLPFQAGWEVAYLSGPRKGDVGLAMPSLTATR